LSALSSTLRERRRGRHLSRREAPPEFVGTLVRRRAWLVVALLGVLLLLSMVALYGCSGGTSTTSSTAGGATTTSAAPATTVDSTTSSVSTTGTSGQTSSPTTQPGMSLTQAQRLSPTSGRFSTCKDCHAFLDPTNNDRGILTDAFGHEKHLTRGTPCEACHKEPVHQETLIRRPSMVECYTCHRDVPGAVAPATCSLCHPPDFDKLPSSHDQAFYAGGHATVVAQRGTEECFACHPGNETTFCLKCHGLPIPHPAGWAPSTGGSPGAHVDRAWAEPGICVKCHHNLVAPPAGCYGGECHGT
jgi:hypothetical protein